MVSDSKQDIQSRLENVAAGSGRLYAQSFIGRAWLADYVADVDSVCDELRAEIERLRAAIRLALQYMTAGGHEYRATQDDGQAAVDTLLGVVR